jgi:hypothetical protein
MPSASKLCANQAIADEGEQKESWELAKSERRSIAAVYMIGGR